MLFTIVWLLSGVIGFWLFRLAYFCDCQGMPNGPTHIFTYGMVILSIFFSVVGIPMLFFGGIIAVMSVDWDKGASSKVKDFWNSPVFKGKK